MGDGNETDKTSAPALGSPAARVATPRRARTTVKTRREALGLLGGAGLALFVAACGGDGSSNGAKAGTTGAATGSTSTTTTPATTPTTSGTLAACAQIPTETTGPYPGDGTNGPNVLAQSGVVRSDIRSSFGSASRLAAGVPLTIALTIVDSKNACRPVQNAAVYVWHCDRDGQYSMYSQAVTNENYLRGVQVTDQNGLVTFTSIFPAAYSGRWPHIHFEVFRSLASATNGNNRIAVSQMALPADVCRAVYATDGYATSVRNLAQTSLQTDMVFSDGYSLQMPAMSGSTTAGYSAPLTVAV
jgi:protocatechuate 3,4-dioxygenase beta subunit